jgi:hypothetical protein
MCNCKTRYVLTTKSRSLVQKRAELLGKSVREGVAGEVKSNQAANVGGLSRLAADFMAHNAHCHRFPQGGLPVPFSSWGYGIILFHQRQAFLSIILPN